MISDVKDWRFPMCDFRCAIDDFGLVIDNVVETLGFSN